MTTTTACLALCSCLLCVQPTADSHKLVPDCVTDGTLSVQHTQQETQGNGDVRGRSFNLRVKEAGPYCVDLYSFDFEGCLALEGPGGQLIEKSVEGFTDHNTEVTAQLEPYLDYRLTVATLGPEGRFRLVVHKGLTEPINDADRVDLTISHIQDFLDALDALGLEHSEHAALILQRRGVLLLEHARAAEAYDSLERSLELWEQLEGPASQRVADLRYELGRALNLLGRSNEAIEMLRLALDVRRNENDAERTARSCYQLGSAFVVLHQFDRAQELFLEAVENHELHAEVSSELAESLNATAYVLQQQGLYEEAGPFFQRAIAMRRTMDPGDPILGQVLSNLGGLYKRQGRYDEAREQYEAAIELYESDPLANRDNLRIGLHNWYALEWEAGNLDTAHELMDRALALGFEDLDDDDEDLATFLNNQAGVYLDRQENERALELYRRALEIRERLLGPLHPLTALSANNLSVALARLGHHEEADKLQLQSTEITREVYGDDHRLTSDALMTYAYHFADTGRHERAIGVFIEALNATSNHLDRQFATMSETDRMKFLASVDNPEDLLYSLSFVENVELETALSAYLRWKGKATRFQSATVRLSQSMENEVIREKKAELRKLNALAGNLAKASSSRDFDQRERLAEVHSERLEVERELNRALGLESILEAPSAAEVTTAIPDGAALVDFFVGQNVYAWVLGPPKPALLLRLKSSRVASVSQDKFLRQTTTRGAGLAQDRGAAGQRYFQSLWAALEPHVADAETIFIVPDGFLCELPFGTMQDDQGTFLVERHRFAYLSDATTLCRTSTPGPLSEGSDVLVVGDVDYQTRGSDLPKASNTSTPFTHRGSGSRANGSWQPLPGTALELDTLSELATREAGLDAYFLVGSNATEEAVRSKLPGRHYVHFATHGYFEPDELWDRDGSPVELLPGLRSGLVLSGVHAQPDPRRDDGFLSAEEIMHLDLGDCDLAVLSACETALGSARAGEGLMSLRRAFEVAGAATVVSSMWKVDDASTAELMQVFYENLWLHGMSKLEALHAAQLRMLAKNRAAGQARPSTWGAFVLSGDWR